MKKILLYIIAPILAVLVTSGVLLMRYPHLPAIVEEGFPAPRWPASGIFLRVTGQPISLPKKDLKLAPLNNEWAEKLKDLNIERETDALLAFHKGELKYAYYRDGVDETTQFNSYSMVKSLIGVLVMKAIDEGEIGGLQTPIGEYLIDLPDKNLGNQTIERFLTMQSGLKFEKRKSTKPYIPATTKRKDKDSSNPFSDMARLHVGGLQAVMNDLRIPDTPSTDYHYQNVNTALLGAMLRAIYKKPLNELLSEKLWKPAGAAHARWRTYTNEGSITPYCCLFATANDWGKVAHYINTNGTRGSKFLSGETRQYMLAKHFDEARLREGVFGLHIRHNILDRKGEPLQGPFTYFVGHNGQLVYLMPSHDLVVVRFGRSLQLLHSTLYYLWRIIRPNGE